MGIHNNRSRHRSEPSLAQEEALRWLSADSIDAIRASELPTFKEPVRQRLIEAAQQAFYRSGYHGTTMRVISANARITVGAPYHYYDSKQAILHEIMERFMRWSLQTTRAACQAAKDDPRSQLVTAVWSHVYQHSTHQVPSFVVNNELRSLDDTNRAHIVELRDELQSLFDVAVERGCDEGVFRTPYVSESSRAIVTMCTSVASWFQSEGPLSPVEMADRYVRICLDAVGHADSS